MLALWCGGGCRWLLQQGREEEAKAALRTIRQEDELEAEINMVRGHNTKLLTERGNRRREARGREAYG